MSELFQVLQKLLDKPDILRTFAGTLVRVRGPSVPVTYDDGLNLVVDAVLVLAPIWGMYWNASCMIMIILL